MKLVPDSNGNRGGECKEDRQRKEESKRDGYLEENVEVNNSVEAKKITQRKICFRLRKIKIRKHRQI